MIEILNGITETINYGNELGLRLFHNVDYEDYPEHWHVGIEIIMPVVTDYTVLIGNDRYKLLEGEILIINSGVIHGLEAPPTGERIVMQFNPVLLYTLKEMETTLAMMPSVYHISPKTTPDIYSYVKTRMDMIIREYDAGKPFSEGVIYAELIQMFAEIGRYFLDQNMHLDRIEKLGAAEKQKEYMSVIMKACNYINIHYQEKLSLEEVADRVGFSKFHFTRIFKQYTNMTFCEYLNKRRVKCAEGLLFSTDMRVTDVAMNSGFSSMSSFDRTFKAVNGNSPSQYRESLAGHTTTSDIPKNEKIKSLIDRKL